MVTAHVNCTDVCHAFSIQANDEQRQFALKHLSPGPLTYRSKKTHRYRHTTKTKPLTKGILLQQQYTINRSILAFQITLSILAIQCTVYSLATSLLHLFFINWETQMTTVSPMQPRPVPFVNFSILTGPLCCPRDALQHQFFLEWLNAYIRDGHITFFTTFNFFQN